MRKGVAYSRAPTYLGPLERELARLSPKAKHPPQLWVSTQQLPLPQALHPTLLCWSSPLSRSPSASGCC